MGKRKGASTRPRTMGELLSSANSPPVSQSSSSSSVVAVGTLPLTAPQPATPMPQLADASSQPAPQSTPLSEATPQLGPLATTAAKTIGHMLTSEKKRKVGGGRPRTISDFLRPTSERSSQLSGSSPPASGAVTLPITEPTPNATPVTVVPSASQLQAVASTSTPLAADALQSDDHSSD